MRDASSYELLYAGGLRHHHHATGRQVPSSFQSREKAAPTGSTCKSPGSLGRFASGISKSVSQGWITMGPTGGKAILVPSLAYSATISLCVTRFAGPTIRAS